jgi:hypothetical protein
MATDPDLGDGDGIRAGQEQGETDHPSNLSGPLMDSRLSNGMALTRGRAAPVAFNALFGGTPLLTQDFADRLL